MMLHVEVRKLSAKSNFKGHSRLILPEQTRNSEFWSIYLGHKISRQEQDMAVIILDRKERREYKKEV